MAIVTLDSIREGVEKKYASFDIKFDDTKVSLINPLRLPKERRDKLSATIEEFQKEGDTDPVEGIGKILDVVAESKAQADKLKSAVGGDLPVLMEILNSYLGEQKVGEASPSAN